MKQFKNIKQIRKYNISFKLIETDRTQIAEYPHLGSIVGIKDMIKCYLENLGFKFESFQISHDRIDMEGLK